MSIVSGGGGAVGEEECGEIEGEVEEETQLLLIPTLLLLHHAH